MYKKLKLLMMRHIKNSLIISIILLLYLISCKKHTEEWKYYSIRMDNDSIPYTFLASLIIDEADGIRKNIQYRYSLYTNKIEQKTIDIWQINNKEVFVFADENKQEKTLYLSTKVDTCIEWNHPDALYNNIAQTIHCYKGIKNIQTDCDKNIQVYEFIKITGNDVVSKVYYDESFVLIRQEYVDGNCPSFILEQIKSIPYGFKILLDDGGNRSANNAVKSKKKG